MKNDRLTIVIPVYNVESYLPECLSRLSVDNCKIVLVNDGSTDNSGIICQRFAIEHAKNVILVNKRNGGLSDARNCGIKYVRTEYVFFLDSDDFIDISVLYDGLRFAIENDLDWLQLGYAYLYKDNKMLGWKYPINPLVIKDKAKIISMLVSNSMIKNFAWGKLYRTSTIKNILFPKGKFYEDAFWQYKVIDKSNRFGIYPAVATYYRQRTDGLSSVISLRQLDLLDGMIQRLEYIKLKFPLIAPDAAFDLWINIQELMTGSKGTDIHHIFLDREMQIKNKYGELIKEGIGKLGFIKRTINKVRFFNKEYELSMGLIERMINRISSSPLKKYDDYD